MRVRVQGSSEARGWARRFTRVGVAALVAGIAAIGIAAKSGLGRAPDRLSWSQDSRYVLAGIDGGSAVRVDLRGKATVVPETGLGEVRLSPEGRLVLGARGSDFVSVDLETAGVESMSVGEAQGKPVVWMRGPFGDVVVTKAISHYSIRRTGGRSSDADAAPTRNFRTLWVDPTEPVAYVDTGYGVEVRHLRTGLTLRAFDSGRRDQRYVGAVRDSDGRLILAVQDAEGFRMWAPPDPPGPAWEVDDEAPKSMSGDALQVAVGTARGVELYATATRELRASLRTRDPVAQVAFSPDGTHVAAALTDGAIKVWPVDTEGLASPLDRPVSDIDVGRIRSDSVGRGGLQVRKATRQLGLAGATAHVAWTPTGTLSGWVGGALTEIDPTTGRQTPLRATGTPGRPYAWSPDGKALAVVTDTGVSMFETRKWKVTKTIPTGGGHGRMQWRGDVLVVDAGSGRAQAWSVGTGEALGEAFSFSSEPVSHFTLSPDGEVLAVTGRMPRIVRATDGDVIARLDGQWAGVLTATFSPDGRRLATAGGDGTVLLWDTGSWKAQTLIEGAHGRDLAFSPDGRKLVSASWEGAVIANTDSGIVEEQLAFSGLLSNVDWSPQGIAMVDNAGSLYLWPELPPL